MTLNLMRSLILISLPFCCQSASVPAIAQITPDNTLGSESSVVTPNVNINGIPSERIDGGAIRDTNLFHSFQELNVGEGRGAYFSNPSGIENILGRVTGINRSNILGTLGVLGNANLFLINPNGILFGPNARLDLRGSFVGSTANSLMFDNGFEFSATNPQAPTLLTVNIPIGLRFREPAAPVLVQGVGQNLGLDGATGSFDPAFGGLRVQPGETLTLAGGNVLLDGGILEAPGGRVQLGGLAAAGTLGLNPDLSFVTDTVARADVTLTNRAGINVIAGGGGNIAINAQNLNISQASLLTAGIGLNQGFDGSEAGDIQLNATGTITIAASRIEDNVNFDAIGNSGDINIVTDSLFLTDNAQLDTSTFGQGIGGNILIDALNRVALTDSDIFSTDSDFNSGSPGNILINANNQVSLVNSSIDSTSNNNNTSNTPDFGRIIILSPEGLVSLNQSLLDTTNAGSGLAGDIEINARDEISVTNSTLLSRGFLGRIFIGESTLFDEVSPPTRVVIDGANLITDDFGSEVAGDIVINALDSISITNQSTIASDGVQGRIFIGQSAPLFPESSSPRSVTINGAMLTTSTDREGQPANISIDALDTVSIENSNIFADASGSGNAGSIFVLASNFINITNGFITSEVLGSEATGNGGDIVLTSGSISLTNGTTLRTTNPGSGLAGNIEINAIDQIIANQSTIESDGELGLIFIGEFIDPSIEFPAPTRIEINDSTVSTTNSDSDLAGDIVINATDEVAIVNGSTVSGNGNFGTISIGTSDDSGTPVSPRRVRISASSVTTNNNVVPFDLVDSNGMLVDIPSGFVSIDATDSISITDGSRLEAFTTRNGNAGNVILQVENGEVMLSNSSIFNTVEPGGISDERGSIDITANSVSLTDGAQLNSGTSGQGDVGNININDADTVSISGFITSLNEDGSLNRFTSSGIFTNTQAEASGAGGDIQVTAGSLQISDGAVLSANSRSAFNSGAITLNVNALDMIGGGQILTTAFSSGAAGNITVNAPNGSVNISGSNPTLAEGFDQLLTQFGEEEARTRIDIDIDSVTTDVDTIINTAPSGLQAQSQNISGTGSGSIMIETGSFALRDGGAIETTSLGAGKAGDITIVASDSVTLETSPTAPIVSRIFSDTGGSGNAGDISVQADESIDIANSFVTSEVLSTEATGNGGIISLIADSISLTDNTTLRTTNPGLGFAGEIEINASNQIIAEQSTIESAGVLGSIFIGEFAEESDEPFSPTRVLIDNSRVSTDSLGLGFAGDIEINAREDVSIANASTISSEGEFGFIYLGDDEDSSLTRSIMINDSTVSITNTEATVAGNIEINAREEVSIARSTLLGDGNFGFIRIGEVLTPRTVTIDNSSLTTNNSAVDFNVASEPIDSGLVSIAATDRVSINSSSLEASTSRNGNGGDIDITGGSLSLRDSLIDAGTFVPGNAGQGNAGSVTLNVDNNVSLRNSQVFSDVVDGAVGNGGDITVNAESLSLRDESILSTRTAGQGSAGRITINVRERVAVRDRSQIESNSETFGQTAGNISITADTLLLEEAPAGENQANIRTNTRGIEGNINLRVRGLILRQGGRIFANASEEAEGGNITIDNTAGLVALENSDITANAQQGRGGEVRITAQGVFGTEFRDQLTSESDITATSELGREFFGTVEINRPDVDPSRGLVTLPVNVVDPASLIADNPCQEGEGSEFTVTGRGGLPSNPGESLRRDAVRVDLVEPAQSGAEEQGGTRGQGDKGTRGEKPLTTSSPEKIVPAQGWVSNEKGEVVLTAYAPTSKTPQRPWRSPNPACPAP